MLVDYRVKVIHSINLLLTIRWENGTRTFLDPIGINAAITSVTLDIVGVFGCGGTILQTSELQIYIQNDVLGPIPVCIMKS